MSLFVMNIPYFSARSSLLGPNILYHPQSMFSPQSRRQKLINPFNMNNPLLRFVPKRCMVLCKMVHQQWKHASMFLTQKKQLNNI